MEVRILLQRFHFLIRMTATNLFDIVLEYFQVIHELEQVIFQLRQVLLHVLFEIAIEKLTLRLQFFAKLEWHCVFRAHALLI